MPNPQTTEVDLKEAVANWDIHLFLASGTTEYLKAAATRLSVITGADSLSEAKFVADSAGPAGQKVIALELRRRMRTAPSNEDLQHIGTVFHIDHAKLGWRIVVIPSGTYPSEITEVLSDGLMAKLAGQPGITMLDRADIDKVLKEQNFQNSDRISADTAVRIGKLLGAEEIVMVNANDENSTHLETLGDNTTKVVESFVLQGGARIVDVESGAILGVPTASFNSPNTSSTGDPKMLHNKLVMEGVNSVAADIAAKLSQSLARLPEQPAGAKAESPLIAGIANGSVFINKGSSSGIKVGEHLQVMRSLNTGLNDPATEKPIAQRHLICTLVIANVDDSSSWGSCKGDVPQSGDVAEPTIP
jgi:hypothetical protein